MKVIDLVSLILNKMNSRLVPQVRNEVLNEIEVQCLNAERAKQELGWRPRFTLDEGLNETIRWYRSFFGGTSNDITGRDLAATHSRSSG